MKFKQQVIMFLLILTFSSAVNDLFPQNTKPRPTRQSSFEAFSKENYEQAFNEFSELLLVYPKDPLYNYYSGVCLVRLNKNPEKAVVFLKQALHGTIGTKTLPSDGYFFLGRAQQMSGKYADAIDSYNMYTDKVGKKTSKESGIPDLIRQCKERTGAVIETDIKPAETVENITADSLNKVTQQREKTVVNLPVKEQADLQTAKKEEVITQPVKEEIVVPPVNKEVSVTNNLPASYEKLVDQALEFQYFADSLNSLVTKQKGELDHLNEKEKALLKQKISKNEMAALNYQKSADQKFTEASAALNPNRSTARKTDSIQQPEIKEIKEIKDTKDTKVTKEIKDTVKLAINPVVRKKEVQSDTIKKIPPVTVKNVELYSFFNIISKPEDLKAKITIDPEVPEGLIYRIQVGVFRNPVTVANFNGISPIYGFKIPETDKTVYYAGMFRKSADANKALTTVRAKGFKDSFIVALSGAKKVSPDRAVIMEKEWGGKPFAAIGTTKNVAAPDTVPPSLSFKVEVVRSQKPLKGDVTEGINKIAGNRTLVIQTLNDGSTSYLISKFITFESAAEYADLLKRNGYSEAKVLAFMGDKEIPIETAKQLFENNK